VPILEDAAHAIGTHYKGREVGGQDTAIFSLHPIKNITSGEGGVLTTNDDALAQKVRRLRFHGLEVDAHQRKQQGRSPLAEVQEPGYKQNMPDMNAILAVRQLPRLDAFAATRSPASTASAWRKSTASCRSRTPSGRTGTRATSSWCASTNAPAAWTARPSWKA
jgi:UDP-4-amino-4-deoxy-L-arabinose-oxoglutarate aminotransferase